MAYLTIIKSTLSDVELYGCNTARTDYETHEPTHLSVYSMSNNTLTLRCRSNGTFAVGSSGIFRIKFGYQCNFILDAELYL